MKTSSSSNLQINQLETQPMSELEKQIHLAAKLENYEIERQIGSGGFGHVYRARDKRLDRLVALKFFVTDDQRKIAYTSLKKEAEAASQLSHENIVQIYSWHASNDLVFFSMELIDGVPLSEYLKFNYDITETEILRILAEAAEGLKAAHQQGILHRDIKPQNILISRDGKVKIADFGLSKAIRGPVSVDDSQVILGTLGFMSPDQALGNPTTVSCDLYSLAATGYYMFAGVSPYAQNDTKAKLLTANQQGKFTPLREVVDHLPIEVYRLITKGLNSQQARRFQTAAEFKSEVEQCLFAFNDSSQSKSIGKIREKMRSRDFVLGLLAGLIFGSSVTALIAYIILGN